jgi:hypothetical protein
MKTKRAHRGMSLSQAMKMAKKHYKKGGGPVEDAMATVKGAVGASRKTRRGGGALSPASVGGRRRKTRKFRLF